MYEEPYQGTLFKGLPINIKYPMSERYLKRAHAVYRDALTQYSKVFMFHVTLRFPVGDMGSSVGVISVFVRSLRERVKRDLARRRSRVDRVHYTDVHYVWCREVNREQREHYHFMVIVNANTYRALGCFDEPIRDQLAGMVRRSWASAIGVSLKDSKGLVHFSGDIELITTRQIPNREIESPYGSFSNSYESGFFWLSYLCKLTTKQYGGCARNFGSSYC